MIRLPEKVKQIIQRITDAGFEAYAVGGCIRDSLLMRTPDDWDITTSAAPFQVKELFSHTVDTGIKHGTVTVLIGGEGFEVTTYRIDGKYEDGRHPSEVIFTPSLEEDLKRRDFTINAMAYNEKDGLVDIFDGMGDMERGLIRCVGDPAERFSEDALRMMRAVRFSAQLGYQIEEPTAEAIRRLAPDLKRISAERIRTELVKLAVSPHPEYLRTAYELGITKVILPEFDACMETPQNNPHHCYNVGEHTLESMRHISAHKVLRLAMLLHDIGKPETVTTDERGINHFHGHPMRSEEISRRILRRLKFDNHTIDQVTKLVKYHDYWVEPSQRCVRRAVMKTGEDIFPLLLQVKRADMEAQSGYQREEKEENLKAVSALYEQVVMQKQCVSLKTLAVSGRDLMEHAGMSPGKKIGEVLNYLLNFVIEDPSRNEKEILIREAERYLKM
ncbi:MAG: CCA tRNA nucleotidyltransferase [Lachnospiraceae bacterium]|nr:CCA tRNA nucleotidyltransferase [Lachnospiraceae bacterium]